MIDWQTVIIAAIAAIPGALIGAAALIQAIRTHKAVNSRMDTLLKLATDKATAEATVAERGAEEDRKVARAKARRR